MSSTVRMPVPMVHTNTTAPPRIARGQHVLLASNDYRVCLARTEQERDAIFRLRFLVFNLEMNEGLDTAYETGRDNDEFDPICDHIFVQHAETDAVVATYRLQTGDVAGRNRGYYSEQEFEFAPFVAIRHEIVELGRACIHADHRSFDTLTLLWRGIIWYANNAGARYLIGCSSVTTQDVSLGSQIYHQLAPNLVAEELRTRPTAMYSFDVEAPDGSSPKAPRLLRSYLAIGAGICGPPAIDRGFKTIDFLTIMDLANLSPAKARFLGQAL